MGRVIAITMRKGSDAILDRVLGLLRRRCLPVRSLWYHEPPDAGLHAIQLVLAADDDGAIAQAKVQLQRLPDVLTVTDWEPDGSARELAMLTLAVPAVEQVRALGLTRPADTRLVAVTEQHMVLEVVSQPDRIDALVERVSAIAPVTVSRTGVLCPPAPLDRLIAAAPVAVPNRDAG